MYITIIIKDDNGKTIVKSKKKTFDLAYESMGTMERHYDNLFRQYNEEQYAKNER